MKVRSRQSLSWTRPLLSARRHSAMWGLEGVPDLMVGNLSSEKPCWRVYLQSGVLADQGVLKPSSWPQEPLEQLLGQSFASRREALEAIEVFSELYGSTSEAGDWEAPGSADAASRQAA